MNKKTKEFVRRARLAIERDRLLLSNRGGFPSVSMLKMIAAEAVDRLEKACDIIKKSHP